MLKNKKKFIPLHSLRHEERHSQLENGLSYLNLNYASLKAKIQINKINKLKKNRKIKQDFYSKAKKHFLEQEIQNAYKRLIFKCEEKDIKTYYEKHIYDKERLKTTNRFDNMNFNQCFDMFFKHFILFFNHKKDFFIKQRSDYGPDNQYVFFITEKEIIKTLENATHHQKLEIYKNISHFYNIPIKIVLSIFQKLENGIY